MFFIPTTAHYCAQQASADPLNESSSQHAGPISPYKTTSCLPRRALILISSGRDPSAKAVNYACNRAAELARGRALSQGHDRAFVLPNKREPNKREGAEGFCACLSINPVAGHRLGRMDRGLVMVIGVEGTGKLVGGANFCGHGSSMRR